jgi:hypothetical protein
MQEMKEILSKGGEPVKEFELEGVEPIEEEITNEEPAAEVEEYTEATEDEVTEEEVIESDEEEPVVEEDEVVEEDADSEEEEAEVVEEFSYNLEEIPEYVQLSQNFASLQEQFDLVNAELNELRTYKLGIERVAKQSMIDKFYMLSAEDKKDVVENIDSYSLDEIEAKLCVACFRKGINFVEENKEDEQPTTYNLNNYDNATPDWVEAVEQHRNRI